MWGMSWWQWLFVITGGFLTAIVVFLLVLLLWLRAKWRSLTRGIGDLMKGLGTPAIPQTLRLERVDANAVAVPEALTQAVKDLQSLGLATAGPYKIGGQESDLAAKDGLLAYTAADTRQSVSGLAIASNKHGVVIDFATLYTYPVSHGGGRIDAITHTTLPDQGLETPPQRPKIRGPGLSANALLERHLAERPGGHMRAIALEEIPDLVRQYTEEEYFWRASRGGASEGEVRKIMEAMDPSDLNDPKLSAEENAKTQETSFRMTLGLVRGQATAFLEERLQKAFLDETPMSAREWERVEDRLFYVYDAADPQSLASEVEADDEGSTDEDRDGDVWNLSPTAQRLADGPTREVFADLNQHLPPERKCELIGTVVITSALADVTADVYARPEESEDEQFDDDED